MDNAIISVTIFAFICGVSIGMLGTVLAFTCGINIGIIGAVLAFACGVCIGIIGTVLTTVISKNDKGEDDGKI